MPTNVGAFVVLGAIEQKWLRFGGAAGQLGRPTSNEAPTFDGVGRAQNFTGGIMSWHPKTGPQVVWGLIGSRWLELGREKFGYPITDEMTCPDGVGRFNHFRPLQLAGTPDASIYWSPASGPHEIYGDIRAKWASLGWERGVLGYPVEAEHDLAGGGRTQRFQGGDINWTPASGASEHMFAETATFDAGVLSSNLPLGGRAHLVVQRNGNFTLSTHAHDSGWDNIDYGIAAVLMTATGTAYTLERAGHVEGTVAGLPFGTPNRDADVVSTGLNPAITADFDNIVATGKFSATLTGQDKLIGALEDLLAAAAKEAVVDGAKALVTLIAA